MSDGALRVGDLYAVFTASIAPFQKSLKTLVGDVQATAAKIEGAANKIGQFGAIAAASMGAAMAVASKNSMEIAAAADRSQQAFSAVSTELAQMMLPAVERITEAVNGFADTLAGLSPETKGMVANLFEFAAVGGLAAMAIGKVAGAISGVASLAKLLLPLLSAPFLQAAVAVGAVVVIVGALYRAWTDTSTGFKKGVLEIWEVFKSAFTAIGTFVMDVLEGILDVFGFVIRSMLQSAAQAAKLLGQDGIADALTGSMKDFTGAEMLKTIKSSLATAASFAVDAGKTIGGGIAEGVAYGLGGVKQMLADSGLLELLGGGGGARRGRVSAVSVGTASAGAGAGTDFARSSLGVVEGAMARLGEGFFGFATITETVGDKLLAFQRSVSDVAGNMAAATLQGLGNAALGQMPGVSNMLSATTQGAAVGGPAGAAAGAITSLLSQSRQFQEITGVLNGLFQDMADTAGQLLEPLLPLVKLLRDLFAAMKPVTAVLAKVLAPILGAITEALRWFYTGMLTIVNLLTGHGASSFSDAVSSLSGQMHKAAVSAKGLAESAAEAAGEILNAPAGFRVEAYRYNSTDTSGSPPATGGGNPKGPATSGGGGRPGGITIPEGGAGPGGGQQPGGDRDTPRVIINLHGSTLGDFRADMEGGNYRRDGTRISVNRSRYP